MTEQIQWNEGRAGYARQISEERRHDLHGAMRAAVCARRDDHTLDVLRTGAVEDDLCQRCLLGSQEREAVAAIQELRSRFVAEIDRPLGWFNTRFGQSFAVLTCCRMLYTSKSGTVQSKLSGVKWAEQSLDPAWRELIRKAWTERVGVRFGDKVRQPAQTRLLHETAKFIAHAQSLAEASRGRITNPCAH